MITNSRISVFSHDAGGASLLAYWCKNYSGPLTFCLSGPAIEIFEKVIPNLQITDLHSSIQLADTVITGSGWQSELEKKALSYGINLGKHTILFLDHWVNYLQRLQYNQHRLGPSELWVADIYAYNIARTTFPDLPVTIVGNPYLDYIVPQVRKLSKAYASRTCCLQNSLEAALYLSDNIYQHDLACEDDQRGYSDKSSLLYSIPILMKLKPDLKVIRVRLHPSESPSSYGWVRDYPNLAIDILPHGPLEVDLSYVSTVFGNDTMAMVVALESGKEVYCSIPPGSRECSLPHTGIIHLSNYSSYLPS